MKLRNFKVLTFDCYGTLIDWESGMIAGLAPLTAQLTHPPTRDQILEAHAYYESTQQRQTPAALYPAILATVYRRLAEEWGIAVTPADCAQYGRSVKNWPAFDDSAVALQYLKQHYKLVILSNVDHASFAASNAKLDVAFDAIYVAEDIGTYKPHPANFDYMLTMLGKLGYGKADILHTAESMFHDLGPANQHGVASAWIHRRHQREGFGATMPPGTLPAYDFRFTSMAELAAAHRQEMLDS